MNCICGFQFESKTVPFAVQKFAQSVLIFLIISFVSLLTTREHYLYFYIFDLCFAIFAYVIFKCCFTFKAKVTAEPAEPAIQMVETERSNTDKT